MSALVREMSTSLQSEWTRLHDRLATANSALVADAATMVEPAAAHDRLVGDVRAELVELQHVNDVSTEGDY